MNNAPKTVVRVIGILSIILASLGLWYNTSSFFFILNLRKCSLETPYFKPAFFVMSLICIACYVVLLIIGVKFVRLKSQFRHIFVGLLIFEVVYFLAVLFLWLVPARHFARSIAAATGIANGGLMFQFITLFPLWAPLLVSWAHKRIHGQEETIQTDQLENTRAV